MFALALRDCFAPLFQKRKPSGLSEKTPFFFLQSFFFWGYLLKRKSDKEISVSIKSATNYSNGLYFIHFFFAKIGTKKKFPKRNADYGATRPVPAPLCVEHHL
jgi:hypothetical protein